MTAAGYAQVVVDVTPAHLDRPFDYAVPDGVRVQLGSKVRVPFAGRRRRDGWVVGVTTEPTTDPDRIKPLAAVLGEQPWFDATDLTVWRWVADRFGGTLATVIRHALPARVARVEHEAAAWPPAPTPQPRPVPDDPGPWAPYDAAALLAAVAAPDGSAHLLRPLPGDDVGALLVDLVRRTLAVGRTALLLTPDPAPGEVDAVLADVGGAGVDLRGPAPTHGATPTHGGATTNRATTGDPARHRAVHDADRHRAWLRLRTRHARVAVGERSLALLPVPDVGLIVVLDEASPAYKERRAPRHHAREAALARARLTGAVCLLVTDLPSAAAWRNLEAGHITPVRAPRATERDRAPAVHLVDRTTLAPAARQGRLAEPVSRAISRTVDRGGVVVVLVGRRGEGSALACAACATRLECPRCGGGLAAGEAPDAVRCGSCDWTAAPPPRCPAGHADGVVPLLAGAGRLAGELGRAHPGVEVVRMEGFDAPGPTRRPAIAVMTRGSVLRRPSWLHGEPADLLVLPDVDALLARPAVDAAEDALRLWLGAARWAREVVVQTTRPADPTLQALLRGDPEGFWRREAPRRAALGFPPAGQLIALRGLDADLAAEVRAALPPGDTLLGPGPDGVALVKSGDVRGTLTALTPLRHAWGRADTRVAVDVDPIL